MQSIYSLIPEPDSLLGMEVEELAGYVMQLIQSSNPKGRGMISTGNLISQEWLRDYPKEKINDIRFALIEALQWLKNEGLIEQHPGQGEGWVFITRRGQQVKDTIDLKAYRKRKILPKELLHTILVEKVWTLFSKGDYDTSVFQAFKQVEVTIRDSAEFNNDVSGVELVEKAYHPENGKLTPSNQTEVEKQATLDLFKSALVLYKNPITHHNVSFTAEEAAERIIFANHLLNIVKLNKE